MPPSVAEQNPSRKSSSHFVIDRRQALSMGIATASTLLLPKKSFANADATKPVRFGIISDIHKDVMHDADSRLDTFVKAMIEQDVDFILQLGDFCIPATYNLPFMKIWNSFSGPRHHVLGNHDMDGNGTERPDVAYGWRRAETVEYWGMKSPYYSFDHSGVHFIILDGNDKKPEGQSGYRRWVGEKQLEWLEKDLQQSKLATFVFIHQSPENIADGGVENGKQVQAVLEKANAEGDRKVIACFTGHHHRDYLRRLGSIWYPQINSASYYWLGGKYLQVRYSEEIDAEYPYIKYTVPYKDPLFAVVTVDLANQAMSITGGKTEFVGPSPWEQGASREELDAESLVAQISNRQISLERK